MKISAIEEVTIGSWSPASTFRRVAGHWQKHVAGSFGPYRPERHYMRGPGPKCRAKHGLPER